MRCWLWLPFSKEHIDIAHMTCVLWFLLCNIVVYNKVIRSLLKPSFVTPAQPYFKGCSHWFPHPFLYLGEVQKMHSTLELTGHKLHWFRCVSSTCQFSLCESEQDLRTGFMSDLTRIKQRHPLGSHTLITAEIRCHRNTFTHTNTHISAIHLMHPHDVDLPTGWRKWVEKIHFMSHPHWIPGRNF